MLLSDYDTGILDFVKSWGFGWERVMDTAVLVALGMVTESGQEESAVQA